MGDGLEKPPTKKLRLNPSISLQQTTKNHASKLFEEIRSIDPIILSIYFHLPPIERIRLGQVDKKFFQDSRRGRVVGLYGALGMTIMEALKIVQEYQKFYGNPNSSCFISDENKCWTWLDDIDNNVIPLDPVLLLMLFNKDSGYYNIPVPREGLEEENLALLISGLKCVNAVRENNFEKLRLLDADIASLGDDLPGYNALFEIMRRHDFDCRPFLEKEWFYDMPRLTPDRGLILSGKDGRPLPIFKKCTVCKSFKSENQESYCIMQGCVGSSESICDECSTLAICSVCDRSKCLCILDACCVPDCGKLMCRFDSFVTSMNFPDIGEFTSGPACSFVLPPLEEAEVENEGFASGAKILKYCETHKPAGALLFHMQRMGPLRGRAILGRFNGVILVGI
mmetsp:Transcript_19268/g.48225  ORF Transcript_19268/g.48225 Transcript_19268/m.48225 type:complete len:396 (-) Transcript_19268:238-1425(-)